MTVKMLSPATLLVLGMLGTAHGAEQFPFREPGPDRTIFMETSNRECLRLLASHLVPSAEYCECLSNAVAYGMTMTDAKELQRDHATPSFLTMQQTAKDLCATQSKLKGD
jgi:hypothetical protein